MTEDLHSPTAAAPPPPPADGPAPEPAPTGAPGTSDGAMLGSPSATERPEVQAGLAFAGGLLVAMVLRRLTR